MQRRHPQALDLLQLEDRLCPVSGMANPDLSWVLPSQLSNAYGVGNLRFTNPNGGQTVQGDGTGQIIVLINEDQNRAGNFHGSIRLDQNGIHDNSASYTGSDLHLFSQQFGLKQFGSKPGEPFYLIIGQDGNTPVAPPEQNPASIDGSFEFALDASYSHSMAPGASIIQLSVEDDLVGLGLLPLVLDQLSGAGYGTNVTVISMSYGQNEFGGEPPPDVMGLQMSQYWPNATFVVSAGDSGAGYQNVPNQTPTGATPSGTYNFFSMNGQASLPGIVQVGGVSATPGQLATGKANAWGQGILSNEEFFDPTTITGGGSGGGYSINVNAGDNYQYQRLALRPNSVPQDFMTYFQSILPQGTTIDPSLITTLDQFPRLGPDIALQADEHTGVNLMNSWVLGSETPWTANPIGGTSLAAPLLAGLLAVANQGRSLRGLPSLSGPTQTLPMLYRAPDNLLVDVTGGSNGFPAGPGFDLASGLGVPKGEDFIQYLAGASLQKITAVAGGSTSADSSVILSPSDSPGEVLKSFIPFPGFKGPISLAQGDLNSDQIPDLVVSTAGGGSPQVVVFNGLHLMESQPAVLCSFYAFDQAFQGGTSVAVLPASVGVPGRIAVGAGPGGEPALATFHADGTLEGIRYAFDQAFRGGLTLSTGDLNADGIFDVVVGVASGNSPHVVAFDGGDWSVLTSYFAFAPGFSGGLNLAAGDVNADGFADVAAGAARGWSTVNIFSPKTGQQLANFYAGNNPQIKSGVQIALHDTLGLAVKDQLLASVGGTLNNFTLGTGDAVVLASQVESPFGQLTFGLA